MSDRGRDDAPDVDRPHPDTPPDEGGRDVVDLDTVRIEVVGTDAEGEVELAAYDPGSLLDDGNALLQEGRLDEAEARYRKIVSDFPDSKMVGAALFNLGVVLERRRDWDAAIAQYRATVENVPTGEQSIDAHVRAAALLAELSRFAEARDVLRTFVAREDLTHTDRVEGKARLGYVLLELGSLAAAEEVLGEAVAIFRRVSRLDSNYYAAMAFYYLAQIPHRQFLDAPLRLPETQFRRDWERKEKLAILAYDRYEEALEFFVPYWSTAAGYQMSQLYKELWDAVVTAPAPPSLREEAGRLYAVEVHRRARPYLEKALFGHAKNVELAEAYGAPTVWSEASQVRADQITEVLTREQAGELVVPEPPPAEPERATASAEYVPGRIDL